MSHKAPNLHIVPKPSPNIQPGSIIVSWNDLPFEILEYIFYLVSTSMNPQYTQLSSLIKLSHINRQSRRCLSTIPQLPLWTCLLFVKPAFPTESLLQWPWSCQLTHLDATYSSINNEQLNVILDQAPLVKSIQVAYCPCVDPFEWVQYMATRSLASTTSNTSVYPTLQQIHLFKCGQQRMPTDVYNTMWHAHWKTPLVGLVKNIKKLLNQPHIDMDVYTCRECQDYVFFGFPPTVSCSDCQSLVKLDLCLGCESFGIVCLSCHKEMNENNE